MSLLELIVLAWRLTLMAPEYVKLDAITHAEHAAAVATVEIPAEIILGVVRVESHFDGRATSRVVGKQRVTGIWTSTKQAGHGPWFCGVMQTIAEHNWKLCLSQRDLGVGYATGASELADWMRLVHGDLRAALDGHGCGWYGVHHGCNGYSTRVFGYARRLGWTPPTSTKKRAP